MDGNCSQSWSMVGGWWTLKRTTHGILKLATLLNTWSRKSDGRHKVHQQSLIQRPSPYLIKTRPAKHVMTRRARLVSQGRQQSSDRWTYHRRCASHDWSAHGGTLVRPQPASVQVGTVAGCRVQLVQLGAHGEEAENELLSWC